MVGVYIGGWTRGRFTGSHDMIIKMDSITGKCWIEFEYTKLVFDTLWEAIIASENIQPTKPEDLDGIDLLKAEGYKLPKFL